MWMNLENIMLYGKKKKKTYQRDFCSSSVVDSMLPLHGAQVRSLVRDLRSYGQKKKKK